MSQKKQKGGGSKKIGRQKKKSAGKTTTLSAFIRGRITGEEYFRLINQSLKRG